MDGSSLTIFPFLFIFFAASVHNCKTSRPIEGDCVPLFKTRRDTQHETLLWTPLPWTLQLQTKRFATEIKMGRENWKEWDRYIGRKSKRNARQFLHHNWIEPERRRLQGETNTSSLFTQSSISNRLSLIWFIYNLIWTSANVCLCLLLWSRRWIKEF